MMRGEDEKQHDMFSYLSPEQRVPTDHPLRAVRDMVDQILKEMCPVLPACTRMWDGRRSRRSVCCGLCCCRSSPSPCSIQRSPSFA